MGGIKKKVDVLCQRSFKIGVTPFRGNCTGIILDADAIRTCLENKAIVKEVLKNGRRYPLDFSNYFKKNPMGFDVESQISENNNRPNYNVTTLRPGDLNNSPGRISANQPPVAMLSHKQATNTAELQAIGARSQTEISDKKRIEATATKPINAKLPTKSYDAPEETISPDTSKVEKKLEDGSVQITLPKNVESSALKLPLSGDSSVAPSKKK